MIKDPINTSNLLHKLPTDCQSGMLNRPYHGFRRHFDEEANRLEITVFVWKSDVR